MAKLSVNYDVVVDMTEDQFDAMSQRRQNELLDSIIDWKDACRNAEVDDIEIDDLVEVTEGA